MLKYLLQIKCKIGTTSGSPQCQNQLIPNPTIADNPPILQPTSFSRVSGTFLPFLFYWNETEGRVIQNFEVT